MVRPSAVKGAAAARLAALVLPTIGGCGSSTGLGDGVAP